MKHALQALLGLAVGLAMGLVYTWVISPVQYIDTAPNSLRADYQAAYVQVAARAYAVDGDLGRARTRLALVGMKDPVQGVAAQADRANASGDSADGRALAALASALGGNSTAVNGATAAASAVVGSPAASGSATPSASATPSGMPSATPSKTPSTTASATTSATPTVTPQPTDTVVPSITPRLLPTRTPTPTPLAAFVFVGQQQVCDPKLGQPVIQVVTEGANGEQIPGVEVVLTWDNGFDHFFTGLKPELGMGYGDFTMTSGVVYSVHLAESPALSIDGLTVETCSGSGTTQYAGSILLIFKQPS